MAKTITIDYEYALALVYPSYVEMITSEIADASSEANAMWSALEGKRELISKLFGVPIQQVREDLRKMGESRQGFRLV